MKVQPRFAAVPPVRSARIGRIRALAVLALLLGATAANAQDNPDDEYPAYAPAQLAALVAQHPAGTKVTVDVPIAKVEFGRKGQAYGHVFLDSMVDYRDPRSVNVNVFPHAAQRLKFDEPSVLAGKTTLVGKTIAVHGVARRVKIRCHAGCPQNSGAHHYFQTQVFVRDGDDAQIEDTQAE
jgi:hypothetical protein